MTYRARVLTHGYGGYSGGCKCDTCRQAKANYVWASRMLYREIRITWQNEHPNETYSVAGIKHGASGYSNFQCRCKTCVKAKAKHDRKYR